MHRKTNTVTLDCLAVDLEIVYVCCLKNFEEGLFYFHICEIPDSFVVFLRETRLTLLLSWSLKLLTCFWYWKVLQLFKKKLIHVKSCAGRVSRARTETSGSGTHPAFCDVVGPIPLRTSAAQDSSCSYGLHGVLCYCPVSVRSRLQHLVFVTPG